MRWHATIAGSWQQRPGWHLVEQVEPWLARPKAAPWQALAELKTLRTGEVFCAKSKRQGQHWLATVKVGLGRPHVEEAESFRPHAEEAESFRPLVSTAWVTKPQPPPR